MQSVLNEWNLHLKGSIKEIKFNEGKAEIICTNGDFNLEVENDFNYEASLSLDPMPSKSIIKVLNNSIVFSSPKKLLSVDISTSTGSVFFEGGEVYFEIEHVEEIGDEDLEISYAVDFLRLKTKLKLD